MKCIFYILFLITTTITSQTPEIIGTWELEEIRLNLIPIAPPSNDEVDTVIMVVSENELYTIVCDEMRATVDFLSTESIGIINHTINNNNCSMPETLQFQSDYFGGFFQFSSQDSGFFYSVENTAEGRVLVMENISQGTAYFRESELGVDESFLESFTLYPNPTKNKLIITSKNTEIKTISIFNLQGQKVMTLKFQQNEQTVNVSSLQAGVYFLKAESGTGHQLVSKFVKQ